VVKLVSYNSPHQLDEEAIVMTEIAQNDVVDVGGGVGGCEEGVRARSSTPAVVAGFIADAGSEGGGVRSGRW
jgi:hypothetical protein